MKQGRRRRVDRVDMKDAVRTILALVSLFLAITLTACGGGGDEPGLSPARGPVSQGAITALGSVTVNGITFNTAGAAVNIDGVTSAEANLKVGMVVKVRGTSDDTTGTGTATLVEAADALEGTISAVGANSITVMGQTVQIEDNITRLNDDNAVKTFAAAGFVVGDRVEVHGFADDQGGLRATRVAKKATGEFEVKGFVVSTGNPFGLSMTAGGASTLTVTGTLPAGAVVGSFVEVKANAAPVGVALTATSVRLEDAFGPVAVAEKAKVEGFVMSGTVDSFMVNGRQVVTTSATLFEGGLKTDFAVGVKVQAEGALNANKAIVATKVSFRSNIKIEADVTALTAGTSLTVLGKTVAINQYTRIDNGPIALGSHVEVRAMPDRDGGLIATRIVVRNADVRAFLQAPVTAASATAGTMTILGTAITTDAQTQFRVSFDSSDQAVTATTFFAQVKTNVTVVKVRWTNAAAGTGVAVEQAEIQVGKTLLSTGLAASQGVVTALGSVFVNGVQFHTGGAAVMVDGAPAAESSLKMGMTVKVRGTIDDATLTGTADLVEARDALEGTISAVDAANKTLTVMGQTVRLEDNVTRLNDDNLQKVFADGNFAVGDRVEVHGFFDDNGGVRAMRVAKKATGEFEVKGFVVSTGNPFGLSMTSGGAPTLTVTGALPAGAAVGSIVEVKSAAAPSGGTVTATLVKLEDRIGFAAEKVRVEGIVMSGAVTDFTVNGQQVITDANTLFIGGLPADFVVGMKVEAEGPLNAAGAIAATKVSFRSNIRAEANVTAVTATSLTLDIGGTVALNAYTRIDNGPIAVGNHVEVRAFLDRDGGLIASRVRVINADPRIELQGPITANDPVLGTMTILGGTIAPLLATPVTTNVATVFRNSTTVAEPAVTSAVFFAQLKNNVTVVKARWANLAAFTGNLPVTEVEIEIGK